MMWYMDKKFQWVKLCDTGHLNHTSDVWPYYRTDAPLNTTVKQDQNVWLTSLVNATLRVTGTTTAFIPIS